MKRFLGLICVISWFGNIIPNHGCSELSGIGYAPTDTYTFEDLASFPIYPNGVLFELLTASFTCINLLSARAVPP